MRHAVDDAISIYQPEMPLLGDNECKFKVNNNNVIHYTLIELGIQSLKNYRHFAVQMKYSGSNYCLP